MPFMQMTHLQIARLKLDAKLSEESKNQLFSRKLFDIDITSKPAPKASLAITMSQNDSRLTLKTNSIWLSAITNIATINARLNPY